MIGWVQALAFAAVGVSLVCATAFVVGDWLKMRHEERMEKMRQGHEITKEVNAPYRSGNQTEKES